MPARNSRKYPQLAKKTYNSNYENDNNIPDDMPFQTAIFLPKKTYVQLKIIQEKTHSKSRSSTIADVVAYYFNKIAHATEGE